MGVFGAKLTVFIHGIWQQIQPIQTDCGCELFAFKPQNEQNA
jgi:hypothetical protein